MTEQQFKEEVLTHSEYEITMLESFFDYWSEPNKKGKMRWELEKTWHLGKRLKRWHTNNLNWNNGNKFNSTGTKPGTSEARVNAIKNW